MPRRPGSIQPSRMEAMPRTSTSVSLMLIELALRRGVGPDRLEAILGRQVPSSVDPDFQLELGRLAALYEIAREATGDAALGLHLIGYYPPERLQFASYVMMRSSNLREALVEMARYMPMVCPADHCEFFDEGDEVRVVMRHDFEPTRAYMTEHYLSMAMSYARMFTASGLKLRVLTLDYPDPGYADAYEILFGVAPEFHARQTSMIVRRQALELPLRTSNPHVQAFLKREADRRRIRMDRQSSLRRRVSQLLERMLVGGRPGTAELAAELNMASGELHERLRGEGASLRAVLGETRRELAARYFSENMTLPETAYLMGYPGPDALRRAFQNWFGQSPSAFREERTAVH